MGPQPGLEPESTRLGVRVTVVEIKDYIWNTFVDERVSRFIRQYLEERGVSFILGEGMREFQGDDRVRAGVTSGGRRVEADLVLIAVGIIPNVDVAQRSGIEVSNGIVVNEYLETSVRDVYVTGDVANVYYPIEGKRVRIKHWNNAEYTGKLVARNMAGAREKYGSLSTVWSDIFELHIEVAGGTMNYEDYVIRGRFSLENPNFVVMYLRSDSVRGYFAVNREYEELEVMNELISKGVNVSGKRALLFDEASI